MLQLRPRSTSWLAEPAALRVLGDGAIAAGNTMSGQPPPEDDLTLVRAIAGGDKGALARLYDRHAGLLLGVALRIVRERSEAEDLLHDVLLEVWKRAGDYDPERGSVRAWLCLRMRSRALDRQKSPRVRRAVAWDDVEDTSTGARSHPATRQDAPEPGLRLERERVRQAVASLGTDLKDVVELCYLGGFSTAEAALELGCPVGTVKSRLSTARERLRVLLDDTPRERGTR